VAITKTDAGAAPDSSGPGPDNAKSRGQLAQVQQMADFYPAITGALERPARPRCPGR
jgi:hypothetical protein